LNSLCDALPITPMERDVLALAAIGGPYDYGLGTYIQGRWHGSSQSQEDRA
jgi:hypothetical protein